MKKKIKPKSWSYSLVPSSVTRSIIKAKRKSESQPDTDKSKKLLITIVVEVPNQKKISDKE